MKRVLTVLVILLVIALAVFVGGRMVYNRALDAGVATVSSFDTSSPLLDDLHVTVVPEDTVFDGINSFLVLDDGILFASRRVGQSYSESERYNEAPQALTWMGFDGTVHWRKPIGVEAKVGTLYRDRGGNPVLITTDPLGLTHSHFFIDLTDGGALDIQVVTVDNGFIPRSHQWLSGGEQVVVGYVPGETPDEGDSLQAHRGVVMNHRGKILREWPYPTSHFTPLSDGFVGTQLSIGEIGGRLHTLSRFNASGELFWTLELPTASRFTASGPKPGIVEVTPGGDLLLTGMDKAVKQEAVMRVSENGELLWTRTLDASGDPGFKCYNLVPWGEGRWLVNAHRSFMGRIGGESTITSWESLSAYVIDSDGQLLDKDAAIDLYFRPLYGAHTLADGRVLFFGQGSDDRHDWASDTGDMDLVIAVLSAPPASAAPPVISARKVETH